MPRLSDDEWSEIRATWEAHPDRGYAWLTRAAGGPADVSGEAVRKRALKEGWTKVQLNADVVPPRDAAGAAGDAAPATSPADADPAAPDPFAHFGRLHRRDWRVARALLAEAVRDRDLLRARLAKTLLDSLGQLHQGERKDYGLDDDPVDYDEASVEQLKAVASGRRPR